MSRFAIDGHSDRAEQFVVQCRREAQLRPKRNIADLICDRIVNRDSISGSADHCTQHGELPAMLRRQAS